MRKPKLVPNLNPNSLMGFREQPILSDVMGSYTGRPEELFEIPEQDVDDL